MRRLALSAFALLLLAALSAAPAAGQGQYDLAPNVSGGDEPGAGPDNGTGASPAGDNDVPASVRNFQPPPANSSPFHPPVRKTSDPQPGPGNTPDFGAPAPVAPPAGIEPDAPPPLSGGPIDPIRFLRPWPSGKLSLSGKSYDEVASLAVELLANDDFSKALVCLNHLDAVRPDDPDTLFQLGRACSLTGDYGKAGLALVRSKTRGYPAERAWVTLIWNGLARYVRARDEKSFEEAKINLLRDLAAEPPVTPAPGSVQEAALTAEARLAVGTAEVALRTAEVMAGTTEVTARTAETRVAKRPAQPKSLPPAPPPPAIDLPLTRALDAAEASNGPQLPDLEALRQAVKQNRIDTLPERFTPRAARLFQRARAAADPKAARADLESLLAQIPDNFEALLLLGDTLRALGEPGAAEREFMAAVWVRPLDPRPLIHLADLETGRGNFNGARFYAQRALAGCPDLPDARATLEGIDRLEAEAARKAAEANPLPAKRDGRNDPPRPNGFLPCSALQPDKNGIARVEAATTLRRGNRADFETAAIVPAGGRVRVVSRVGDWYHVEILEEKP